MLTSISLLIIFFIAVASFLYAIHYQLEYQQECKKGNETSFYNLEKLDYKKAACLIISTTSFTLFLIVALLKQHYIGG